MFPGENGKLWSRASVQKLWQLVRRRWNLQDVRIHDLRRTCASYLAIEGENLPTIQTVLNHRSLTHTSIYARLNTKAVDRALQAQADRLCSMVTVPTMLPPTHGLPMFDVKPANDLAEFHEQREINQFCQTIANAIRVRD